MSDWLNKAQRQWLLWRMGIVICLLATIDSLASSITSVMIGSEWSDLLPTEKFLRVCLVLKMWAGTMTALFVRLSSRVERNEFPIHDEPNHKNQTN